MDVPTLKPLSEDQARFYFQDLIKGIEYRKWGLGGLAPLLVARVPSWRWRVGSVSFPSWRARQGQLPKKP